MNYCEFCGQPIENYKQCNCPKAQAKAAQQKKMRTYITLGAAVLAVVIIIAVAVTGISTLLLVIF